MVGKRVVVNNTTEHRRYTYAQKELNKEELSYAQIANCKTLLGELMSWIRRRQQR